MFSKDRSKISFLGVGMFLILVGAAIFALGIVMWLFNYFGTSAFNAPSQKVIGGLVVLGIGYIALEIELMRTKKLQ